MGFVGLIMLVGMVKNAIVLIDYINLNREACRSSPRGAWGTLRLRPVLMTTLTTILGMVPLAIGTGQGSECGIARPISIIEV